MMTFRTRAKETVQVQFNEVRSSGVFVAQIEANQRNSMSLLQQNGFRALTYQEALVKIDQNPELKEQLKIKWFYLGGKGPQLSGYYTFNDKGELTQGKGDMEKTVYVLKGSQPLSLDVHADYVARIVGRRFVLDANGGPDVVAPVVVGVRIGNDSAIQADVTAAVNTLYDSRMEMRNYLGAAAVAETREKEERASVMAYDGLMRYGYYEDAANIAKMYDLGKKRILKAFFKDMTDVFRR